MYKHVYNVEYYNMDLIYKFVFFFFCVLDEVPTEQKAVANIIH